MANYYGSASHPLHQDNLDAWGIDLDSTRCPVCDVCVETSQHLFVDCTVARGLWKMISNWWKLGDYPKVLNNLLSWSDSLDIHNLAKQGLDVVIQTTIWIIWRYRNRVCFDSKPPRKDTLGEDIMIHSHSWMKHRNKNINPIWLDWIADPIVACTNRL